MLNKIDFQLESLICQNKEINLQHNFNSNSFDMRTITADINGIIREMGLGENDILIPLFETVVNSVQAIEELKKDHGEITIFIERNKEELTLFEEFNNYPISSIKVIDNGIGFTNENIESYYKVYSPKKIALGGKGIGRFASLSFLKKIDIESIVEGENSNYKVKLHLDRNSGLIEDTPVKTQNKRKTTVILSNLDNHFTKVSSQYNQESIADNLLEHCLLYFLNDNAPTINLFEDNICINLKNQFSPQDFIHTKEVRSLKNKEFTFYFVKNKKIIIHTHFVQTIEKSKVRK